MRKNSRKFYLAVWMCMCLLFGAVLLDGATMWQRIVLMLAAAAVACVWIVCEARVDRAAAPLNLNGAEKPRTEETPGGALD